MFKSFMVLVGLAVLAGPAQAQTALKSTRILQTTTSDAGTRISYPPTDSAEVTALMIEVPPGAEGTLHRHEVPVFIYVLEGTLDVDTEGVGTRSHTAGEGFLEAQNANHTVKNRGTKVARALIVVAGIQGRPVSLKPS